MSRRNDSETGFGSDSFLDIIANIVGILIILIVIAGMKVSRAPVVTTVAATVEPPTRPEPVAAAETPPADPPLRAPRPLPIPRVSAKLLADIEVAKVKLLKARRQVAQSQAVGRELKAKRDAALQSMSQSRKRLNALRTKQDKATEELAALRRSLKQVELEAVRLQTQLDTAEQQSGKVETLQHRVTPVSSEVCGKEIHFRLSAGRVAVVPVEDLVERMRSQVLRQKDWLVKYHKHTGKVGPVRGFTMSYTVERQRMSVVEELRRGQTMMRIALSGWKIHPEADLAAETIEQAMSRGSAFRRELHVADENAVITIWVYPDSFGDYRKLQQLAHQLGFTVAARPLPTGVPIAGSPNGTRSAGQ